MRQTFCIFGLLCVAALLNMFSAARMVSDGNWSEALGVLFIGPIAIFYIVHTLIYFVSRLVSRAGSIAPYATSRLNDLSLVIGLLGAAAQRMPSRA